MADFGLLAGLGEGLNRGVSNFIEQRRYADERDERRKNSALEKALKLKQLKDSGLIFDEESGAVSETEEGTRNKKASLIKQQLDIFSDALKTMPEDERSGTAEGQKLRKKLGLLTDEYAGLFGDSKAPASQIESIVTSKGPKIVSRPNTSTFLGSPIQAEAISPAAQQKEIPGLIKTSKGFLPGKLSKKDQAFNEGLLKKVAELDIEDKFAPPKQNQAVAAGFALRMQDAEQVFEEMLKAGYDRRTSEETAQALLADPAIGRVPYIGDAAAGLLRSVNRAAGAIKPNALRNRQAEQNFVNALLRRESGSAISPAEFQTAAEQYFDRQGDSDELRMQKRMNRLAALAALRSEAGSAYDRALGERQRLLKGSR